MGTKDGKPEWFGYWKGLSPFKKESTFIQDHSMYPIFRGSIGCPGGVNIKIIRKGGVSTLDKSFQVGLKIQNHPTVKEEKSKMKGGAKTKERHFQKSTCNKYQTRRRGI